MSGLMGTMVQGMAWGTGTAVAREAVGAAMGAMGGGGSSAPKEAAPVAETAAPAQQFTGPCAVQQQSFYECLQRANGDAAACQNFFEGLSSCQQDAKAFA